MLSQVMVEIFTSSRKSNSSKWWKSQGLWSWKSRINESRRTKITSAREIYEKLNDLSLELKVAVSEEGVMYGSVGTKEISEGLEAQGFEIERQSIRLPDGSLKEVGESKLILNFMQKL